MKGRLSERFTQLEAQATGLENTAHIVTSSLTGSQDTFLDDDLLLHWRAKVLNLLVQACGRESEHYRLFRQTEDETFHGTNYNLFKRLRLVFLAAKDDFDGGFLASIRSMVQSEVFDSELEQALELFASGYFAAAAVIAGVVLETTLRELCIRHDIPPASLERMNANLVKAAAYNSLTQKQITAFAAIRNSAAHGKNEDFTRQDVERLIKGVADFLVTNL
jgi:hypothetical protein